MKTIAITALLASTTLALSGHGHSHHNAIRGFKSGPHHLKHVARDAALKIKDAAVFNDRLRLGRRNAQASKRASASYDNRDTQRFTKRTSRKTLERRKVLGQGDSASFPDNTAKGTFTAKQGCTVWHTVAPGEVCLGLIDKSSADFTLDVFYKFNPSVSTGCSGLQVGSAYCVDNAPVTSADDKSDGKSAKSTKSANLKLAATQTSTASDSTATDGMDEPVSDDGDDDDCDEEEEGSDDADDNEEDCDDEEDDSSNVADDGDDEDCDDEEDGSDDSSNESSSSNSGSNSGSDSGSTSDSNSNSSDSNKAKPGLAVSASVGLGDGNSNEQPSSTSTSEQSQPTGGSSSDGGNPSQYSGIATYYYQNGNAGACGDYNPDSAYIVALYTNVYSSGVHCGKKVKLTNTATGVSVTATVADECPSCGGDGDIDTSEAVFNVLSGNNLGAGVENVKWGFI